MKFEEDEIAIGLYRDLVLSLEDSAQDAEVSISARGSHARCTAHHGIRNCTVHCFFTEYCTDFQQDDDDIAVGRTKSKADVIAAVISWLQGVDLKALHERFSFVDGNKREYESLRDELITLFPALEVSAPSEIKDWAGDVCTLRFIGATRSCRISFTRDSDLLEAFFYWDDCELFRLNTDDKSYIASIANRWLCDLAMPSEMRITFPGLEIGYLADYYERGNPAEGEFLQSWDDVENTYRKPGPYNSPRFLKLILQMRERGYDRLLRAGISMNTFIISRSRRNGLRYDQPHITFNFREDTLVASINDVAGKKEIRLPSIEYNPRTEELLKLMTTRPID